MPLDRLVRIGRAGRQVSTVAANQARERELVETDQRVGGSARREGERAHGAGAASTAASRAAISSATSSTALMLATVMNTVPLESATTQSPGLTPTPPMVTGSSVALSWTLWLLAKDQASQQRTFEEATAVEGDGTIGAAHVEGLTFCRQVIQEAMRLFPPAPGIGRQARAAMELGGLPIAAASALLIFNNNGRVDAGYEFNEATAA